MLPFGPEVQLPEVVLKTVTKIREIVLRETVGQDGPSLILVKEVGVEREALEESLLERVTKVQPETSRVGRAAPTTVRAATI